MMRIPRVGRKVLDALHRPLTQRLIALLVAMLLAMSLSVQVRDLPKPGGDLVASQSAYAVCTKPAGAPFSGLVHSERSR